MSSNYGQKSLLVAVQSDKGHSCFTKPFLLKMGCENSGWRFLKFWLLICGFLLYPLVYNKCGLVIDPDYYFMGASSDG